jgi:glyoxylase I family protein
MIDLVAVDGPLGCQGGPAAGKQGHNVGHLCLRIEPFDEPALLAYLASAGLEVEKAQMCYGAEGKGWSIYCFDPDGNQIKLKGPVLEP